MDAKELTHLGIPLSASYDVRLVALSLVIAIISSYTALDMAGQVSVAQGWARKLWLTGSAIALGISIWVMHFIAMLAYQLPIEINYNFPIILLSMVVAIVFSGLGLFIVTRQLLNLPMLLAAGILIGMGTIGMHFTAMMGMRLAAIPLYDLSLIHI